VSVRFRAASRRKIAAILTVDIEVFLNIYEYNTNNQHEMIAIPICEIPKELKNNRGRVSSQLNKNLIFSYFL
jgi:hypothetical protein